MLESLFFQFLAKVYLVATRGMALLLYSSEKKFEVCKISLNISVQHMQLIIK